MGINKQSLKPPPRWCDNLPIVKTCPSLSLDVTISEICWFQLIHTCHTVPNISTLLPFLLSEIFLVHLPLPLSIPPNLQDSQMQPHKKSFPFSTCESSSCPWRREWDFVQLHQGLVIDMWLLLNPVLAIPHPSSGNIMWNHLKICLEEKWTNLNIPTHHPWPLEESLPLLVELDQFSRLWTNAACACRVLW